MKPIMDVEGNKLGMTGMAGLSFETSTSEYFIDGEGLVGPQGGFLICTNVVQRLVEGHRIDDLNREESSCFLKLA